DEAKALGGPCLLLVVGGLPQYSRPGSAVSKDIAGARAQVHDAIAEMLEYARQAKMPLAIEPLHPAYAADRACVNTTKQALDICDALDPKRGGALGVALDVYHIWWDPELLPQIARAGKDRLLAWVGWAKAPSRRAHHLACRTELVGTRSLSSGAHSRDPLALPTLPFSRERKPAAR